MEKLSSQTEHISSLEKLLQKPEQQVEHEKIILSLQSEVQQLKLQLEEETKQNDYLITQVSFSSGICCTIFQCRSYFK